MWEAMEKIQKDSCVDSTFAPRLVYEEMVLVSLLNLKPDLKKYSLKISALFLLSKDGLPLSFTQILEGELFPDDNPRDFIHFHNSLGFPTFSLVFQK